jgi:NADH:ubiquinone oxidoreductase subunit K
VLKLLLILVLLFAAALVLVLFGPRLSRGPAATVAGVLLLFILAVPAAVAMVAALVAQIYRRFKSRLWARAAR